MAVRNHVYGRRAGATERKLSWLEATTVADVSADGRTLLLRESAEREGSESGVVLRDMEGAPPVRLGAGYAEQLAADGQWALALRGSEVVALPTGPGVPRSRDTRIVKLTGARFMPDGRRALVAARASSGRTQLYSISLEDDKSYAYHYTQFLSDLYLVDGMR